jgi:photosystem II stability/assembly factor-like uncharacterized protein
MKKIILLFALIISSSVLYSQWILQSTVSGLGSYPSISVYGPNSIVIAGGLLSTPTAKVYKSTNGGVNWTDISGDLPQRRPYALWAVNGDMIFVGDGGAGGNGGDARFYKTTNGGLNWIQILNTGGIGGWFNDIVFSKINPMIGIAQSDPPSYGGEHYLAKTTDGGNNWFVQPTIATNGPSDFHTAVCVDNLFYGWGINGAFGQKKILLTSNGGNNWNILSVNLPGNDFIVSGFAFNSEKTIGIAGSSTTLPNITRTENSGSNWVTLNTGLPVSSEAKMKWVYGTNWCYIISDSGSMGCVIKSTNSGLNWTLMGTAGVIRLNHLEYYYSNGIIFAYAISKSGAIIRLQETITGIRPVSHQSPEEFNFFQNYPNPFNPNTNIRYTLPKNSFVSLKVYDILGKEVATLVNEQLNPGTYEVVFDGTNYPSGVYFNQLIVSSKQLVVYKETKKMILTK